MIKDVELKSKELTELNIKLQKEDELKIKLVGSLVPHEGHKIWEIDNKTLKINEAKFIECDWVFNGENRPKILMLDGFSYVCGLNKKSAIKNYKLGKTGGKKFINEPLKL